MLKLNLRTTFTALVMTVLVAACGGGGGEASAPSSSSGLPASALASVDGLVAFLSQVIDAGGNDTSEPVLLGDSVLPVNDTI